MFRAVGISLKVQCQPQHLIRTPAVMQPMFRRYTSSNGQHNGADDTEPGPVDIRCEVEQWHSRKQSCPHPDTFTQEHWNCLRDIESKSQRRKYCRRLFNKAEQRLAQHQEKLQKQEAARAKRSRMLAERGPNEHIVYGLGHGSLFQRFEKKQFNRWGNLKLAMARQYGVKMLVDCSFEAQMTTQEQSRVACGIRKTFLINRLSDCPLDLHLCGVKSDSLIMKHFRDSVPMLNTTHLPIHSDCYSSMFPKERLVALTPDSGHALEYNGNDVYVVSGLVDFASAKPVTLDKAKSLGIRTAKLPMHLLKLGVGCSNEMPFFNVVNCVRARRTNDNWTEILEANTPIEIQHRYQHLTDEEREAVIASKLENHLPRREIVIDDYGDY